jgi:hypothetical protein
MKRPSTPSTVGDLAGGEIVRLHAGMYRITHRKHLEHRWAIKLTSELVELGEFEWLDPRTKVYEVVPVHRATIHGDEVDPLRCAK